MGEESKPDLTDPQELEKFLDDFFAQKMVERHIPGAVITVVREGEIFLSKGYGYANLEKGIPAHPLESLFRVASVTKIFAAVAVMQLAEKGKIKLDDDVNNYLGKFKVKNPHPHVLRVSDLLTHTDGFEERLTRIIHLDPESMPPLEEVLGDSLKPLILEPGQMITYGSFSMALASYLVEVVSGISFERYVEENILKPLNMENTTIRQDLPPEKMDKVAVVYSYQDGVYLPQPFLLINTPATGGASATATEMGHLLIAFLQNGSYRNKSILKKSSIEQMFAQQFTAHPHLPGVTFGFFERFENGERCLLREGTGLGVASQLFLLPRHKIGFFIAFNTKGDELSDELTSAFLDRYFPGEGKLSQPSTLSFNHARFAGLYRYVQYSCHTMAKIAALFNGLIEVKTEEGELKTIPRAMGDPYGGFGKDSDWVGVEPLLFRRRDGRGWIAFREDPVGQITHLFSGQRYHGSYEKLRWYQTPRFHFAVSGFFVLFFSFTLIIWIGLSLLYPKRLIWTNPGWLTAVSTSILNLCFLILVLPVMFQVGRVGDFPAMVSADEIPPSLADLLAIPLITTVLTFGWIVLSLAALTGFYSLYGSLYLTLAAFVSLLFVLYLRYWNLLGYRF